MNQELYDKMYAILNQLLSNYKDDDLSYREYMLLKKKFVKEYVEHKEEFVAVIKALDCCIGDGVILGSCSGLRCGNCHAELRDRLLNKYNHIN